MSNESSTTKSRRVLVAEDETLIRLDIVETLTDAGYEIVAEAADGEGPSAWLMSMTPTCAFLTSRCR